MTNVVTPDDLQPFERRLESLERKIDGIFQVVVGSDRISTDEIARLKGVKHKSTFSNKPWLLPRFGESPYKTRPREWDRSEWEEWEGVPEEIREEKWRRIRAQKAD